jgi:ferredoxin-NADP reductase/Na+-translocating ferredoxin:NAD+ oxidoreductase RnfD subunit
MTRIDEVLDRITMYRLVLYVLLAYIGIATALSAAGQLPFTPLALLVSTALLVGLCWAANTVLARIFDIPANVESSILTGLILALILDPAKSFADVQLLGWAAILAMASKYIVSLHNKHIFNPAAIAVLVTAVTLRETASWWVGTGSMLPVTVVGGLLIMRKVRQEAMVASFIAAALVVVCAASLVLHVNIGSELQLLVVESPLVFFASIMLTEPLTAPPTRGLRCIYGALVGALFVPQVHVGSIYSTPELALVIGNAFSYLVSPRQTVTLQLKRRAKVAPDIVDFTFKPSQKLDYLPGQYMEFTLGHAHTDSRGNRRYFTLASSPTEGVVRLGVRFYEQGSSFKRTLYTMGGRGNTTMLAGSLAGDFTLPDDSARKLAFIAGGIGITPFRSMLKYLVDTRQRRDIVLLYANRTAQDIVYKDVLGEAEAALGTRVVYTLTDTAAIPRGWTGGRGRISEELLLQTMPDFRERTFYLSGPPNMVRAHEQVLRKVGVPRNQIKKDFFPGLV